MGGFAISLQNEEHRPIFHNTHLEYIIIPEMTIEVINDKSKGDIMWLKSPVIQAMQYCNLRLRSPFSTFTSIYRTIIHPISNMLEPIPTVSTTGRKVATFHALAQLTRKSEHVINLLASVAALVYGALHCAADAQYSHQVPC